PFVVVEFASWRDDPVVGLTNAIERSVGLAFGDRAPEAPPGDTLAETFERWTRGTEAQLLLIMDQFEEYFLYHGGEDGPGTFAEGIRSARARQDLPVNVLISIRADGLHLLDRFQGTTDRRFGHLLRADCRGRASGRGAIARPVR